MGVEALVLGGASLVSGAMSARSARSAADAQADSSDQSIAFQREVYEDQQRNAQPWLNSGQNALAALNYELGLGPMPGFAPQIVEFETPAVQQQPSVFGGFEGNAVRGFPTPTFLQPNAFLGSGGMRQSQAPSSGPGTAFLVGDRQFSTRADAERYRDSLGDQEYRGFQETPGFQYALEQNQQALDRNAAARGIRMSGATLAEGARRAQGLQNQEYGNYLNRLSGLAGTGQTAVGQTNAAGGQAAAGVGNALMQQGQARASGYAGQNQAISGTFNNLAGIVGMNAMGIFD